jgi:drug/metabolite transporter (DMT)-like permease
MPRTGVLLHRRLATRVRAAGERQPLSLVVLGVALYSIGPVAVQASSVPGPVFSLWRLWLGVPILAAASGVQLRAGGRWPERRAWRWALWAGVAFGVHQLLMFTAIKATSVTDVSLVNTLAPIVTAVGALPLFGERPGVGFRLWTLVAMAGAAIVILAASAGPHGDPLGMAMAVGNVVAFSAFFLLSKLGREHIDVLPFLLGTVLLAALTVTAFAVATGQPVRAVDGRDVTLALAVAAGPGAVGHFVMTWPLRWVPANIPPVLRLGQPILSGALAWWLLAEPVTQAHLLGGLLTIVGVCGAVLTPRGRRFARGDGHGRRNGRNQEQPSATRPLATRSARSIR